MSEVASVKVVAAVNIFGLRPGQEAELEVSGQVLAAVERGLLKVLTPEAPEVVPEPAQEPQEAPEPSESPEGTQKRSGGRRKAQEPSEED